MTMVCFSHKILVAAAIARPPGYLQEVLKLGHRRGPDVCMSEDTYRHLREKYSPIITTATNPPPELPTWDTLISNFATESAKWAASGFRLAPKDAMDFRRFQCQGDAHTPPCRHWDVKDWLGTGGCKLCGCTRAKLWLATTKCPASPPRWHPIPPVIGS